MPEVSVSQMVALSELTYFPNGVGLWYWKKGWVPTQGVPAHPRDCPDTLWTWLLEDETRVFYLHGESMLSVPAIPGAFEDKNGVAWIECIDGYEFFQWLRSLHGSTEAPDATTE